MLHILLILTSCVAAIVLTVIHCAKQLGKYKDVNKLPGPSALEYLWNILKNRSTYDKYHYMEGLSEKYGSILKIWIKPFNPVIMVTDSEVIDKILLSKDHLQRAATHDILSSFMGKSFVITNNIDVWRKDRKLCSVAFQHSTLVGFLPIFTKYTVKLIEILKNRTVSIIDVQPLLHLCALDIIFETLAKQPQNFQESKDYSYLVARSRYSKNIVERIYSIFLSNEFIFRFSKEYRNINDAIRKLEKFSQDVIETAKNRKANGSFKNSKQRIIDILISADMREDVLLHQINALIAAGHDTVAQTNCFTLYQLAKHQSVQDKLYKEIVSQIGRDENTEISYNDLNSMTYLEAVVNETLRFLPIIAAIDRKLGCDVTIGGITYPKGTVFVFNLAALHKSEKYFKDPNKFDPDRFMSENANFPLSSSFIPFSKGPRDCIGKLYAMLFVKLFVVKIIQKFRVLPVENHELKIQNDIVTKSIDGVPIIFQERN